MTKRLCNVAGYALSWLVVCAATQLVFSFPLWNTLFTTIFLIFGCLALVEGVATTRFGIKKNSFLAILVEVVLAVAIYTPLLLALTFLAGMNLGTDVAFIPLMVACLAGGLLSAVIRVYVSRFVEGFGGPKS